MMRLELDSTPDPRRTDRTHLFTTLAVTFDDLMALADHALARDGRMSAPVVKRRLEAALAELREGL